MSAENEVIKVPSFNRFINKLSKAKTYDKMHKFIIEFNITPKTEIQFVDVLLSLSIEHCSLLASNACAIRYLHENNYTLFDKFSRETVGFSGISSFARFANNNFNSENNKIIHPSNALINTYINKSFGRYNLKPISVDFIETLVDLFPDKISHDSLFEILIHSSEQKKLSNDIEDNLVRLFDGRITEESVDSLIKSEDYDNVFLCKSSVYFIEKYKKNLYELKNKKNIRYILSSPYEWGMIDKIFAKNNIQDLFERVYDNFDNKRFEENKNYQAYTLGTFSSVSRLNAYRISNKDVEKVKFYVEQFEKNNVPQLKGEYRFILSESLRSLNDCSEIFKLYKNTFSHKEIDHVANISGYFETNYERGSDNFENYMEIFNIQNLELSAEEYRSIILSIFKNKKTNLFNDFYSSTLFKEEKISIFLEEFGKSLSRKKNKDEIGDKEFSFYKNIIEVLNKKNINVESVLIEYLNKMSKDSVFKSYLEKKLLDYNLASSSKVSTVIKNRI